jgi:hypothetical protein
MGAYLIDKVQATRVREYKKQGTQDGIPTNSGYLPEACPFTGRGHTQTNTQDKVDKNKNSP